MAQTAEFRSALHGFHRGDVMNYIQDMLKENNGLRAQLEAAKNENASLRAMAMDFENRTKQQDLEKQNEQLLGKAMYDARRYSDIILQEANDRAEELYNNAVRNSEVILGDVDAMKLKTTEMTDRFNEVLTGIRKELSEMEATLRLFRKTVSDRKVMPDQSRDGSDGTMRRSSGDSAYAGANAAPRANAAAPSGMTRQANAAAPSAAKAPSPAPAQPPAKAQAPAAAPRQFNAPAYEASNAPANGQRGGQAPAYAPSPAPAPAYAPAPAQAPAYAPAPAQAPAYAPAPAQAPAYAPSNAPAPSQGKAPAPENASMLFNVSAFDIPDDPDADMFSEPVPAPENDAPAEHTRSRFAIRKIKKNNGD